MKLTIAIFCALATFQAYATTPAPLSTVEETLIKKGYAVICVQAFGVLQSEDLHNELNKKIQSIKTRFTASQPSLALSLINVTEQKSTDPGSLAILCVTLTKK